MGQLLWVLRAKYLVDAVGLNKIQGRPFSRQSWNKNRRDVGTLGESAMSTATLPPPLTKKDFNRPGSTLVPGCGDYAILSAVQAVFPELGIKKEILSSSPASAAPAASRIT